jgi:hypothetical protein
VTSWHDLGYLLRNDVDRFLAAFDEYKKRQYRRLKFLKSQTAPAKIEKKSFRPNLHLSL